MILNLLNKKKEKNAENATNINLIKIGALLIHAAKVDENYSEKEKKIIINFLIMCSKLKEISGKNSGGIDEKQALYLLQTAEENENNSNQILEYTKEVKKMDTNIKTLVLETLWKIILSDDKSDVYESTLMRRICGLLYVSDKLSGEIKSNILKRKKI